MNIVAIMVIVRAHVFVLDVFMASIIASFEKNPAKNGMPISARVPIVMHDDVVGSIIIIEPIFRMSCSSVKLWIIEPEHRKSIALKKACVQM